jgi:hypothetical protein
MARKYPIRILKIKNCKECPHLDSGRTPGSGYAVDYYCKAAPIDKPKSDDWRDGDVYNPHGFKIVDGYVEWDSERSKDGEFPKWCPLKKASR